MDLRDSGRARLRPTAGKGHRGSAGASPSQNLGHRSLGGLRTSRQRPLRLSRSFALPKKQGQQIGVVIANRYGFSRLLTPREWPLPGSLINAVGRAFPAGARQYL